MDALGDSLPHATTFCGCWLVGSGAPPDPTIIRIGVLLDRFFV